MLDGRLNRAGADAAAVGAPGLHRRDAPWSAALHTAIARRAGDSGAMQRHWYAAMDVLAEYSLDLFSSLPRWASCGVAAARLRLVDRLQHHLDEALSLLEHRADQCCGRCRCTGRVCTPGSWPTRRMRSPRTVRPLTAAAGDSALRAAPWPSAGRAWLRVLANQVDVEEVTHGGPRAGPVRVDLGWRPGWRVRPRCRLRTPGYRRRCCNWPATSSRARAADEVAAAPGALGGAGRHRRSGRPGPVVDQAVRPRAGGGRTTTARDALPRYRQPTVHLGQDRRASRGLDPAPPRRRIAHGNAVDVAGDAGASRPETSNTVSS